MNLTTGQKIMCGVVLGVAMLLAMSIRMSCYSGGTGTIKIPWSKNRMMMRGDNEPAAPPVVPTKPRSAGRR